MSTKKPTTELFSLRDLSRAMLDAHGKRLDEPVASDTKELPRWRIRGKAKGFMALEYLKREHPDSGFPEYNASGLKARKFDPCEVLRWVRSLKVAPVAGSAGTQYELWRYSEDSEPYKYCECKKGDQMVP